MIEYNDILNRIKNVKNSYQTIHKEVIENGSCILLLKLLRNGSGNIKITKIKENINGDKTKEYIYNNSEICLKEAIDCFNKELKKEKKNRFSLKVNDEVIVSDFPEKHITHEDDNCLECLFVFNEKSKNLKKLKEMQFGGKLISNGDFMVELDDKNFEVLGFGADGDNLNSISFFLIKEKNENN